MCLYIQKGTTIGRNTLGSGGQDSNLRSPTYEDGEIDHFSTPGYVERSKVRTGYRKLNSFFSLVRFYRNLRL